MDKTLRKDGRYSGVRTGGREWPELLVGAEEIAAYLRISPRTALGRLRYRRLPARKDDLGRWITTRRLIDRWVKGGMAALLASLPPI